MHLVSVQKTISGATTTGMKPMNIAGMKPVTATVNLSTSSAAPAPKPPAAPAVAPVPSPSFEPKVTTGSTDDVSGSLRRDLEHEKLCFFALMIFFRNVVHICIKYCLFSALSKNIVLLYIFFLN